MVVVCIVWLVYCFTHSSSCTVGGPNGPLAPMAPFFEVAVFVCTVNGTVRFGRLRFNGEDEELGPPAMQQVGDRAG